MSPSPSTSPATTGPENTIVFSGEAEFNATESNFVAPTRLAVRSGGIATITLLATGSVQRTLSVSSFDDVTYVAGKTIAIGSPPPSQYPYPTSGTYVQYVEGAKMWRSTGGGQLRMISRSGYAITMVLENVSIAPVMPLYLAGGASGSATVNFSGDFTTFTF